MKTDKTILAAVAFFLLGATAYAQEARVGINTTNPKTTLDVSGKTDTSGNLLTTDMTGLQAPRLTRAELTAKGNTLYTGDQKGALIYITDISGGDTLSQRANVTAVGYYYFDGSDWQKIGAGGTTSTIDWAKVGTTTAATTTDDQYITGSAIVGGTNSSTASTVASATSGSTVAQQLAKLTVNGGDASINGVTIGKGGGQISFNTAIGNQSLNSNTTGSSNTANGYRSLFSNTTGGSNSAFGLNSLYLNTTGSFNVAIGRNALNTNTTGSNNTANGSNALYLNTIGNSNTAVGVNSLYNNTTGNTNTSTGSYTLQANTTGSNNVANGYQALNSNTLGNENTATGGRALYSNTEGINNTANGYNALFFNTTGNNNSAIGYQAGYNQTSGNSNIVIGASQNLASLNGSNQLNIGGAIFGTGLTGNQGAPAGNIGIGITDPSTKLHIDNGTTAGAIRIVDGTQGAGKVLTSDANGVGTWQTPSGGGTTYTAGTSMNLSGTEFQRAALTGDVTAAVNSNATTVEKIQGRAVANTAPSDGQVLTWDNTASTWKPAAPGSGADNWGTQVAQVQGVVKGDGTATNKLDVQGTNGGVLYGTGASSSLFTAAGTSGQVLQSNGAAAPTWVTPSVTAANVTSGANVTAGSTKVTLGGTPTGAALKAFSVDVDETKLTLANQIAGGTNGQVLTSNGSGVASWAAVSATVSTQGVVTGNGATTNKLDVQGTNGGVLYGTGAGTSSAFTAVGTSGQILKSNGAAAPSWVSPNTALTTKDITTAASVATATSPLTLTNATGQLVGANNASLAINNTAPLWNANQLQGTSISTTAPTTNQVLSFDGTNWSPSNAANIYTANGTIGTNRTVAMADKTLAFTTTATSGTSQFTVDGTTFNVDTVNNRVGIGVANPTSTFEVNGASTNTSSYNAGSGTTIDFTQSNLARTTADPGNTFTLSGLKDGGTYTLAVWGTNAGAATFVGSGLVYKSSNNGLTIAGTQTLYTIVVIGGYAYVNMLSGL